jgi:hypothetical protein
MAGISIKSEVFAVGSTLYEIVTGSEPCKELSDQQIRNAYRQGNFPSLTFLAAFRDVIPSTGIKAMPHRNSRNA